MPKCIVTGCKNRHHKKKIDARFTLHLFPNSADRIKCWLLAIGQDFGDVEQLVQRIQNPKKHNTFRICSDHFAPNAYYTVGVRQYLKPDSVPTVFLHKECPSLSRPSLQQAKTSSVSAATMECDTSVFLSASSLQSRIMESQAHNCLVLPHPQKRFMDGKESSLCTFSTSVCEGTNTEEVATTDRATSTEAYFGRRTVKTQTMFLSRKKDAMTSTDDFIVMKDASTWTGLCDEQSVEKDTSPKGVPDSTKPRIEKVVIQTETRPEQFSDAVPPKSFSSPVSKTMNMEYEDVFPKMKMVTSSIIQECTTAKKLPNHSPCTETSLGELAYMSEPSPEDIVEEKKFLVFEACLDTLLSRINRCCYNDFCKAPIIEREKKICGTLLIVQGLCKNYHRSELWRSQPMIGERAAGNILFSAAILFSGSHYTKVLEMFNVLGMPFISKYTYNVHEKTLLFPVIGLHYKRDQQANISALKGKTLCLSGNSLHDNPGYSAKYCTYTLLEENSKKIISCETVQAPETTAAVAIESKAFRRCLNSALNKKLKISIIATNRHTGIRKILQKEYKSIHHEYDILLYCKRLAKKLNNVAKKKSCGDVAPWTTVVINHMLASSSMCKGNVALLRDRWNSVLHHIVNEHYWHSGTPLHRCDHPAILHTEERTQGWLNKDSVAFREVERLVKDSRLQKDLKYLAQFCHNENIEVFHNLVLKYRPKQIHFTKDGVIARTKIAVLVYNNNIGKQEARNGIGRVGAGYLWGTKQFQKRPKIWQVENIHEYNSIDHMHEMLADVIRAASGELIPTSHSYLEQLPSYIASTPSSNALEEKRTSASHPRKHLQ